MWVNNSNELIINAAFWGYEWVCRVLVEDGCDRVVVGPIGGEKGAQMFKEKHFRARFAQEKEVQKQGKEGPAQ